MKVYVILESFTDYYGGNASSFGVFKTKESAIKAMPKVIAEDRYGMDIEEFEDEYNTTMEEHFTTPNHDYWVWDTGDDITEFYIQEDVIED